MSHFYYLLNRINPLQIVSLTLSNFENTPGQIQLFYSLFSLKDFVRLESFRLIQPANTIELNQILNDLQMLESIKNLAILHCPSSCVNHQTFLLLSSFINTSISLRRLELSGGLNPLFEYSLVSQIKHLYFNDNLFNTVTLETIFSRFTHLQSLDTAITLNMNYNHLPILENLTRLTVTIFVHMKNLDMKIFLEKMPSLSYLKINANGYHWFNGNFWKDSLPMNLKRFLFNFSTQSVDVNQRIILQSFQTPFWLDVKRWYVMLDYQMHLNMTHLYTLPYYDEQYYYTITNNSTRSHLPSIPVDEPHMNNVTKLTIDISTLSNLFSSPTHYFSNVSSLILVDDQYSISSPALLNFLESILDLSNVHELKLGQYHHADFIRILYDRMPRLHSLRIPGTLLNKLDMMNFDNIRSLNICDCLTNVERMHSMFRYVENLCVRVMRFEQMREIIQLYDQRLLNITFRQTPIETQERFIQWLHHIYQNENRQFSFNTDEHLNLYIWFNDSPRMSLF